MRVLLFLISSLLIGCDSGGDLAKYKYHVKLTVVDVGACGGGEGFFSASRECAISAKDVHLNKHFGAVYGNAVPGMTVYKHCWILKRGEHQCFTTTTPYIRKTYHNTKEQAIEQRARGEDS